MYFGRQVVEKSVERLQCALNFLSRSLRIQTLLTLGGGMGGGAEHYSAEPVRSYPPVERSLLKLARDVNCTR